MGWKIPVEKTQLAIVAAIVSCGAGTILFNRLGYFSDSSLNLLLLSIPVAVGFLLGAGAFERRQWTRKLLVTTKHQSPIFAARHFLICGDFGTFLVANSRGISHEIGRCDDASIGFDLRGVSWFGSIIRLGGRSKSSNNPMVGLTLQDSRFDFAGDISGGFAGESVRVCDELRNCGCWFGPDCLSSGILPTAADFLVVIVGRGHWLD